VKCRACRDDPPCERCEARAEARIENRDDYSRDRENDRADREAKW
jgi:hypothetical protein